MPSILKPHPTAKMISHHLNRNLYQGLSCRWSCHKNSRWRLATVVMTETDYITKTQRNCQTKPLPKTQGRTDKFLPTKSVKWSMRWQSWAISVRTQYLTLIWSRGIKFYHLPKPHKPTFPNQTIPVRPIISSCGTWMQCISVFVDNHLQPLVLNIPSNLKDTTISLKKWIL